MDLAKAIRVNKDTVRNWEDGAMPRVSALGRKARAIIRRLGLGSGAAVAGP